MAFINSGHHSLLRLATACLCALLLVAAITGCSSPAATTLPRPATPAPTETAAPQPTGPVTFAVIGDYGMDNEHEAEVASLVASWDPAYVITTGDDYYTPAGGTGTGRYDESTGAYYSAWLKDISTTGSRAPVGKAAVNAFFPSLGNHDYTDAKPALDTYLTYFTLPGADFTNTSGNERYYDFVNGRIHFFVLNSNAQEPDGITASSKQARWLKTQLAASDSEWNIVYNHHPPYSSDDRHGSTPELQWPFAQWGADAVISGHAHIYERVMRDGIVYLINGLGGAKRYGFREPTGGSAVRYNAAGGVQKVTADDSGLLFEFYNSRGERIDSYTLTATAGPGN